MYTSEVFLKGIDVNYKLTDLSTIESITLSGGVDKPMQAICGVLLFCVGLGASVTPAGGPLMITAATMVIDSI